MDKILILGAQGMLGKELGRIFNDKEVHAWDREDIDIADKEQVNTKINALAPDIIINAAAINLVDEMEEDEQIFDLAKQVNGHALDHLAEIANVLDVPLVHFSSDYVFDGSTGQDLKETSVPNPQSQYGHTKLLGEINTKKAQKHYIIRLSRLFGEVGDTENAKKSFVQKIIEHAKTKETLSVIDDEIASITYAPDLARFTRQLIDGKYSYGIYHGANAGRCSWFDLTQKIFQTLDINTTVKRISASSFKRPAKRPPYSVLANNNGPRQRSWEKALKDFLGDQKK